MTNAVAEAIDRIGQAFEEHKKVTEQQAREIEKGNEARAKELQAVLERIGGELDKVQKEKVTAEKRIAALSDRLEVQEALNDRPGKSAQEKLNDAYEVAFLKSVRSGFRDPASLAEMRDITVKAAQYKDVSIGTAIAGGYALPESISADVERLILKNSDIVPAVKNVQVGTSDYKELVTIHGGNSSWVGETSSRTGTNTPNLRERAPTFGELYAYPTASNHSLEDIFFDVRDWLINDIADGQAVALSQAIFDGNGSSRPTGMTASAPVTTDDYASPMRAAAVYEYIPISSPSSPYTSSGVTAVSLVDLQALLRRGYQANASFAMNSVTRGHIRKLRDSNGQFLWQPSLQAGTPDSLLGKPIIIWEEMGNPTSANAYAVAYGDFKRAYVLANRTGLAVTQEGFTAPGFTKFYARRRVGGCPLNNDALKFLKVSVS